MRVNGEYKTGAGTGVGRVDADRCAKRFADKGAYAQSESGTLDFWVEFLETVEDYFGLVGGNAYAGVCHREDGIAAFGRDLQFEVDAAARSEFGSIV